MDKGLRKGTGEKGKTDILLDLIPYSMSRKKYILQVAGKIGSFAF